MRHMDIGMEMVIMSRHAELDRLGSCARQKSFPTETRDVVITSGEMNALIKIQAEALIG